jgi:hypothetical protein
MAIVLMLVAALVLPQTTPRGGRVVDATGRPLAGATVTLDSRSGTLLAVSADDGTFTLPPLPDRAKIVVSLPGFDPQAIAITPASTPLVVTLRVAAVEETVVVRAAPTAATGASLPIAPLDVVRTAGTQADLMRAIGGLPGVARIDEGAGLFVRGGDVGELLVLLDGVVVTHPYRYETPTGGYRGAIDPFLIQGASFSSGGFSAAYGNSLSAVVDLTGQDRPADRQINVTAGLAGVSVLGASPLGSRWGVRGGANRAMPSVLFAVNPSPREFDRLPGGWDLSGSLHGDFGAAGRLRIFGLAQADHVGVELEKDAFAGFLHSSADHRLTTVRWDRSLGPGWRLTASAGADRYASGTDVGVMAITERERNQSGRVEIAGPAWSWTVQAGADAVWKTTEVTGRVPVRGGDFGGVSGFTDFDVVHRDRTAGAFTVASRSFGRLTPELGVRFDRYRTAQAWTADPRIALRLALTGDRAVRIAWGRYHQAPGPSYFDRVRGAARLAPLGATHLVVGYDRGTPGSRLFMRAEGFYKRYDSLPLEDDEIGFVSTGYGSAHGLDYYFRTTWSGFDLKLGASWLDARRRWTSPAQRDRYPLPAGTWAPDFSIPYSWQVAMNVPVARGMAAGLTWRVAAGRPTTPAIGAVATPAGFEPVWGAINSERLPRYERLDLSASVIRTLGANTTAIFFASVDNVLGRGNFFEYAYSADYSERRPVAGATPRSIYFGCSITR